MKAVRWCDSKDVGSDLHAYDGHVLSMRKGDILGSSHLFGGYPGALAGSSALPMRT